MTIDISSEIQFRTARSGGSGGQNVNKVETMVEGRWSLAQSAQVDTAQLQRLQQVLANRITADGHLLVKSQSERTQLGNKQQVIQKMNALVAQALQPRKSRKATKPTKSSQEKRLQAKKQASGRKADRRWSSRDTPGY